MPFITPLAQVDAALQLVYDVQALLAKHASKDPGYKALTTRIQAEQAKLLQHRKTLTTPQV